jgi:hypothetical protein
MLPSLQRGGDAGMSVNNIISRFHCVEYYGRTPSVYSQWYGELSLSLCVCVWACMHIRTYMYIHTNTLTHIFM